MAYVSTGVKGADELLDNKGIPKGYSVLVLGAPGSGKTTLGLQFLMAGVAAGDKGVYVSMDEQIDRLMANADRLGLRVTEAVKSGKVAMLDASPIRVLPAKVKLGPTEVGRREFALAALITSITEEVKKTDATRLVIDPVSTLTLHYTNDYERRVAFLDLLSAISKIRCTSLLLSELSQATLVRVHEFDEFITDGVVLLTKVLNDSSFAKVFSVEKMRGVAHDAQPHPYVLTEGGISVFPEEQIF